MKGRGGGGLGGAFYRVDSPLIFSEISVLV